MNCSDSSILFADILNITMSHPRYIPDIFLEKNIGHVLHEMENCKDHIDALSG